jgi:ferredoxin-NADP reductase
VTAKIAAAPAAAPAWQPAIIQRIVPQTPRVVSVFVHAPIGAYDAGQHVDIRVRAADGYEAERSYSIASAPGAPELELAIERLEQGEVSPYFHEVARPGDAFEIRGPIGGDFVWRADDGGPLLMVGGGSGIVPLMSMARHRAKVAPGSQALLVYSARTSAEVIFYDELLRLEADDPNFTVTLTTTREPRQRSQDFDSRLDRALTFEIIKRWGASPRHAYVCGGNAFVEAVTSAMVADGIDPRIIRTERYGGRDPATDV